MAGCGDLRYYNVLAQGDIDTMRSFLDFYLRALPFVNARTKAQFKGTDAPELMGIAALYEETTTQFGTYMPSGGLGWGCGNASRAHGASQNSFIRFHWTGALELSLLVLDLFDWQSNLDDLQKYQASTSLSAAVVMRAWQSVCLSLR